MLKKRIIPVLLLRGNSIVKSVQFQDHRMVGDAMSMVKVFDRRKADEMVILDIDGYKKGSPNFDLIKRFAKNCNMPLSIGGGLDCIESVDQAFNSGADKVVINSALYRQPNLAKEIVDKYGTQALVVSLDVKSLNDEYYCFSQSAQQQQCSLQQWFEQNANLNFGELLINSIDQDGMMQGFDIALLNYCLKRSDRPVILCGGASTSADFITAVKSGADAVCGGSIFYWEGESIISAKKAMLNAGINVRDEGVI